MKELLKLYIDSYRGLSRPAWLLALVMLVNRTGAMVLPFLGIYMTQALHFSISEVGVVLACFGLGAVTGSWLGGWLTDRFGNFWVQTISLLASVPLFMAAPLFTSVKGLAAVIYILSVVTESFRPANSVSVARYARPENITRAFSLNRMAINLGFSIGPALGGFLASISYHWIFYGNALGAFIASLVFIAFFAKRKGNTRPKPTAGKGDKPSSRPLSPYRDWTFLLFSLFCCIYAICFFQLLSTLPLFYQQGHALNEKQVGIILGFSGFVVVVFEMLLVHIAERRLSYASSIFIGTALCAVSFALLPIPTGYWILYASIFLLSISEILAMPFMASVAVQRASKQTQGAYMGLNALAFSAAHVFSPFLGTRIADHYGFNVLWWGTAAVLMCVAWGLYLVVRKL
ncbi:Predicted arabinose efflux permease, MFS family [Parapedobacter composti]|uniref:Predicted arabinose efflux permease, MFS family n=1 Tax=Parapedobacter composti TaxID=623281 RepID=A0A1I1HGX7_9SPHI|nr:MFS transporter [Parapedobacter composti]SFC22832.1 Predicted arabinose efflux permease, MFS family [Parapedobacter composti]